LTNDEVIAEIGGRLRTRRLERNQTVDGAASATGLNRKTVLEIENGHDVRFSTVVKLLRHFGLLGGLDAALPDTLPGTESFSTRGKARQRASRAGSRSRQFSAKSSRSG